MDKVRIDKWLWAARFFKTRGLAKAAIENGRVLVDDNKLQKTKPSRMLERGLTLKIRQGFDDKTIVVTELSDQRRGATEAQLLYRETQQSIDAREKIVAERKALNSSIPRTIRPNKKQRRQIHRFLRSE
jgi:ribosome-associated heat shock protein Hsp15